MFNPSMGTRCKTVVAVQASATGTVWVARKCIRRRPQSNQWAIETLASLAQPGANSRERAQAWLRFKGYQPGMLRIDALTRLGARLPRANTAFDDHPSAQRCSDRIETVTADSVLAWLACSGMAQGCAEIAP